MGQYGADYMERADDQVAVSCQTPHFNALPAQFWPEH